MHWTLPLMIFRAILASLTMFDPGGRKDMEVPPTDVGSALAFQEQAIINLGSVGFEGYEGLFVMETAMVECQNESWPRRLEQKPESAVQNNRSKDM